MDYNFLGIKYLIIEGLLFNLCLFIMFWLINYCIFVKLFFMICSYICNYS